MKQATDKELVELAKAGDVAAFETLYRRYNARLYNFALLLTLSHDDAADVTQESFIRAWNSLPALREGAVFGSWVHRIALNVGRDLLKKRGRSPVASIDGIDGSETSEIPSRAPGPEQTIISGEVNDAVHRAIRSLSEDHRTVVTMHHLEGMDIESISSVLGVSKGTIMSRLSRAREILRRKLVPYVEGESR